MTADMKIALDIDGCHKVVFTTDQAKYIVE